LRNFLGESRVLPVIGTRKNQPWPVSGFVNYYELVTVPLNIYRSLEITSKSLCLFFVAVKYEEFFFVN
jgi:hypothetical protein